MQLKGIVQQIMGEKSVNQVTEQVRGTFQKAEDEFVSVVNSCKTFSTGCSTQKDHNIMKACGALLAKTLVKQEYYTEGFTGSCVKKLGMTLPDKILARSKTGVPGSASISRLSVLKASECSAQELYDMLSKQLKKPDTAPEMQKKIRAVLGMAENYSGSIYIRETEVVKRYVDEIKKGVISDILVAHDINHIEHNPVLDAYDVATLESMQNS
ncbi:hypothetical protein [Morganella morganii]|uniref:hypothetical protein n=1 Tax=Morganella morganii TaxID=582 RepID=UPI001419326B|nr:hypothetical protein [Morganella morganii]NIH20558.1 hypothetical protein [Morganella morganii]